MKKCDKCKTSGKDGVHYMHEFGETYQFCSLCTHIIDQCGKTGIMKDYLRDDHGGIKMNAIQKNMLDARLRRARGETIWCKVSC